MPEYVYSLSCLRVSQDLFPKNSCSAAISAFPVLSGLC